MPVRLTVSAVGSMLLLANSCMQQRCSTEDLEGVFSEFAYVGAFAVRAGVPLPPHGNKSLLFPNSIRQGHQYVFHATKMVTTEHIAIVGLPERLRAARFSILDQPRNPGDFAIVNHGGPIWEIRFSKGSCKGKIYNRIDDSLYVSRSSWPSGSKDDYILDIED